MIKLIKGVINNENKSWQSYVVRFVACIVIAVCFGLLVELRCNLSLLRLDDSEKGEKTVDLSTAQLDGFVYEDGALVMTEEGGSVTFNFDNQYVNKLDYTYEADGALCTSVYVKVGPDDTDSSYNTSDDNNNQFIRESVQNIYANTGTIRLEVLQGTSVKITGASLQNVPVINYRRMTAVITMMFAILFLLCCPHIIAEKIEVAYVLVALGMGISFISILPTQKVAWDECYHFNNAYRNTIASEVGVSDIISTYMDDKLVWPLNQPQTYEEYQILNNYLDENVVYDKGAEGVQLVENIALKPANIGYLASGLGISIARIFKLPFSTLFILGRLFNLIMYVVITYFAIKRCSIGKRLMTILALMPTLILSASVYSRDACLNAFVFLGMSYMLSEFVEKDKKITWKNYLIITLSIYIAASIKAIYAPLLLLLLLLPKSKFKDTKTRLIMKCGIFVVCLLLVASFVIPTAVAPSQGGDSRGGNTSTAGQLRYIFTYPLRYTKLLLRSIRLNMIDYTIGAGALGELGHQGTVLYTNVILLIMTFVTLTDDEDVHLSLITKLGVCAMAFTIICFVWTSMYLSFTEVGVDNIAGVQGRYYVPVIYPMMMVFSTDKIKTKFNKRWYNTAIFGVMIILQYLSMYDLVIRSMCS